MPAAVLVVYDGKPEDPEAFLRYYIDHHLPLVARFPRIRRIEIERVVDGDIFMIARFTFDSAADAKAALESKERERARADRANFPPFKGVVRHQIVEITDYP